jgi:hypothetical protein
VWVTLNVQVLQALVNEKHEEGADDRYQAESGDDASSSDNMGRGAVAYLTMQAFMALGRDSEAQMELLTMASAPDTPLTLCMSAIKVCHHFPSYQVQHL